MQEDLGCWFWMGCWGLAPFTSALTIAIYKALMVFFFWYFFFLNPKVRDNSRVQNDGEGLDIGPSLYSRARQARLLGTRRSKSGSCSKSLRLGYVSVRAENGRPRRSVGGANSAAGSKKYYFSTEVEEPSNSGPVNAESAMLVAGAAAVVGLGFGKYVLS